MLKQITGCLWIPLLAVNMLYGQATAPAPYGPLPTQAQLRWHEIEMYAMVCFGPNTYTDKEWGYGDVDPALFNPTAFSADQIAGTLRDAGFKGVLLVAKHHDGFCLWPSKTTAYSVAASPWEGGKGDMVKAFATAAHKAGLQFGIYNSPWDRNNAAYGTPSYIGIYRQQLEELYRHYGPLFISWHDGANGGDGYYGGARQSRTINRNTYYQWDDTWRLTRRWQPGAVIFSDIGPDVRWVGNESGFAAETSWATFTPKGGKDPAKPAIGDSRYTEAPGGNRDGRHWIPAECDVPLRPGWYYHASQDDQVRSAYELFDIYFKSVGRGACLDIGVAPDRRGILHENDVRALKGFGQLLQQTFSSNLLQQAVIQASNARGGNTGRYAPEHLLDNNRDSYWATDDSVTTPAFTIRLNGIKRFNIIRLREYIALGQRVEAFAVDIMQNNAWQELLQATSIGAQRLIRLPDFVRTDQIRVRILRSPVCPVLSEFAVFAEPDTLLPPVINIGEEGRLNIRSMAPAAAIRYTVNGRVDEHAVIFRQDFTAPEQGIIRARCYNEAGEAGPSAEYVLPADKKNWHILSAPGGKDKAAALVDDKPHTIWQGSFNWEKVLENAIVIDMGQVRDVYGFLFVPPATSLAKGITDKYRLYTSTNGTDWEETATGEFANIRANPVKQLIDLPEKRKVRYIRFIPTHIADNSGFIRIAEMGIY